MKERMDAMQAHVEALTKVVEAKSKEESSKVNELGSIKLVPLSEKDDIEAYLVTFERIMEAHKVAKERWSHYLAPQLTGKAQLAFAALPSSDSGSYDRIKVVILQRYDINDEAYRRRFRSAARKNGETNRELAVRLMDCQGKWLRECKSMEEVMEAIGREQFLNCLSTEKRLWVLERKPKTCIEAGELADEYEQVQKQEERSPPTPIKCHYCGRVGHEKDCRKKKSNSGISGMQCYNCKQFGHPAKLCPSKANMMGTTGVQSNHLIQKGQVEGKFVTDIMLDTGCSKTMVHKRLVPDDKVEGGEAVTIRCAHGDTVLYPVANIRLEVAGQSIEVTAAVSSTLPVSVLLGTDVAQLSELLSGEMTRQENGEYEVMVVTTRAEAARKQEETIREAEREAQVTITPNPITEEEETQPIQITRDQQRQIRQKMAETSTVNQTNNPFLFLDMPSEEMSQHQEDDPTLAKIRNLVNQTNKDDSGQFFKRNGLYFRRWVPRGQGEEMEIEQLLIPSTCREAVLKLAHEVPTAGHLGCEKTSQRILRRFYWPTVFADVKRFCGQCSICQKTSSRRPLKAPMIPLPIISEPFSRIAMDIVGPLPKSQSGNKYLLVICDYATR
jgi:predicted aspartyl protease